jgi:hypothetical protein
MALGTWLGDLKETSGGDHLAASPAEGTSGDLGTLCGTRAAAVTAGIEFAEFDLLLAAAESLFERDPEVIAQIRTTTFLSAATAAEEMVENPASASRSSKHLTEEVKGIVHATPTSASSTHAALEGSVTISVVGSTFLRIAQDIVGFGDLAEALLGSGIAGILIRVMLDRELAVRLLDILELDGSGDLQYLVVTPLCHSEGTPAGNQASLLTMTLEGRINLSASLYPRRS